MLRPTGATRCVPVADMVFPRILYGGDGLSSNEWISRRWHTSLGRPKLFWSPRVPVLRGRRRTEGHVYTTGFRV